MWNLVRNERRGIPLENLKYFRETSSDSMYRGPCAALALAETCRDIRAVVVRVVLTDMTWMQRRDRLMCRVYMRGEVCAAWVRIARRAVRHLTICFEGMTDDGIFNFVSELGKGALALRTLNLEEGADFSGLEEPSAAFCGRDFGVFIRGLAPSLKVLSVNTADAAILDVVCDAQLAQVTELSVTIQRPVGEEDPGALILRLLRSLQSFPQSGKQVSALRSLKLKTFDSSPGGLQVSFPSHDALAREAPRLKSLDLERDAVSDTFLAQAAHCVHLCSIGISWAFLSPLDWSTIRPLLDRERIPGLRTMNVTQCDLVFEAGTFSDMLREAGDRLECLDVYSLLKADEQMLSMIGGYCYSLKELDVTVGVLGGDSLLCLCDVVGRLSRLRIRMPYAGEEFAQGVVDVVLQSFVTVVESTGKCLQYLYLDTHSGSKRWDRGPGLTEPLLKRVLRHIGRNAISVHLPAVDVDAELVALKYAALCNRNLRELRIGDNLRIERHKYQQVGPPLHLQNLPAFEPLGCEETRRKWGQELMDARRTLEAAAPDIYIDHSHAHILLKY